MVYLLIKTQGGRKYFTTDAPRKFRVRGFIIEVGFEPPPLHRENYSFPLFLIFSINGNQAPASRYLQDKKKNVQRILLLFLENRNLFEICAKYFFFIYLLLLYL